MNTVVFLVETSQIIAVLFVNYKGRPWMKAAEENHALFLSVFLCIAGVCACAWEMNPWANKMIHLVPFPDDGVRLRVLGLVLLSLFGTFIWDRLVTAIFARKIFGAMMRQAAATTLADLAPIFSTMFKVALGLLIFATGNPLVWIGAVWYWRRRTNAAKQAEQEQLLKGAK